MDLISRTVVELGSTIPNADVPLMETGLDSIAATELSSRLGSLANLELPTTLAFDQPTPRAMVDHVLQLVDKARPPLSMAERNWHKRWTVGVAKSSSVPTCQPVSEQSTNPILRMPASERRSYTMDLINRTLVDLGADEIPSADVPLMETGLDSIAATELASRLSKVAGVELPTTLAFDQPSSRAMTDHVLELVGNLKPAMRGAGAPSAPLSLQQTELDVLGVQGTAIKVPGDVNSGKLFASMLWGAGDAVHPIPSTRWMVKEDQCSAAAFMSNFELFDAAFFGITGAEASQMDPQQRVLLEMGYEALHSSSQRRGTLMGSSVGVYVAIEHLDWQLLQLIKTSHTSLQKLSAYAASGEQGHVASGRLSFALDLRGPTMSINTACSSGVVSIHLDATGLRAAECDLAIRYHQPVGGGGRDAKAQASGASL